MRRLLLIVSILLLLVGQGWAAGTSLTPVDYLPARVFGTDGNYLYMVRTSGDTHVQARLLRSTSRTTTPTEVHDFDPTNTGTIQINSVWAASSSLLFVNVNSYIYKSVDNGVNFGANAPTFDDGNYVLACGTGSGEAAQNNPLADRGYCKDTVNNQLLIGEYNAHAGRVAGADFDQVYLWKSIDNGTTWSVACKWNTDGSNNNVRHIHAVRQDPYTGLIYICFGDDSSGGIIRWDGVSALTVNQNLNLYPVNYTGNSRCTVVDMLFTSAYCYSAVDLLTAGETGIWQIAKDLSSSTRVNFSIDSYPFHTGYFGLKTTNGTMIWSDKGETGITASSPGTFITNSPGDYTTWGVVGQATLNSAKLTEGSYGFFEFGNEIYYTRPMGGKLDYYTTIVLTENTTAWSGSVPDWLHPAFWVNTVSGSDAAPIANNFTSSGYRPAAPWKTIAYGLSYMPSDYRLFQSSSGSSITVNPTYSLEKLTDGSIENWTDATTPVNWTPVLSGTSTINQDTVVFEDGLSAVRYDIDVGSDTAFVRQNIVVNVDDFVSFSYWARASATLKTITSGLGALSLNTSHNPGTTWTKYIDVFQCATQNTFIFPKRGNAPGASLYVDNMSCKVINFPSTLYLLGSRPNPTMQVNMVMTANLLAGVFLCADSMTNPQNIILVWHDGTRITCRQIVNGTWSTPLAATVTAYSANAPLKVVKSGTTVTVYYNGLQVGVPFSVTATASNAVFNGLFSTYAGNSFSSPSGFSAITGISPGLGLSGGNRAPWVGK